MSAVNSLVTSVLSYPRAFWFLCLHMFLFMSSFSLLIPEMNDYISSLGGADNKWMIMGLWTLAAGISRPFSGKIADNISRKSVMYFGVILSIIISFIYPYFTWVSAFLTLRLIHGFSTGFQPTGASALVADVIPMGKRGEAMGIFGVTFTLGFSGGQVLSSSIKGIFGIEGLFYACGIMGIISLCLLFFVKEDRSIVRKYAEDNGNQRLVDKLVPKWNEFFGPEVIQPSVVMFLTAALSGMYFLMIPDLSSYLGYENKGYFWFWYMMLTIVTRIIAGKLTDRYGARNNLYLCCLILATSAYLTGTATTNFQFQLSAVLYGIGSGISSPSIFAWTADLSNPSYKGRGMGTMFVALEFGMLTGVFLGQKVYNNNVENFDLAFGTGALLCLLAFLFVLATSFIKKKSVI